MEISWTGIKPAGTANSATVWAWQSTPMQERGMNMNDELLGNEENDTVTLTLDDDTEIVCDVITIFPCGNKKYIALLPQDSDDDGEVYLYEFQENGDEPNLINIESDEEFEAVSDAFEEWLDSEEFDEMFGDDEED